MKTRLQCCRISHGVTEIVPSALVAINKKFVCLEQHSSGLPSFLSECHAYILHTASYINHGRSADIEGIVLTSNIDPYLGKSGNVISIPIKSSFVSSIFKNDFGIHRTSIYECNSFDENCI
jgi:hypothetical protein